MQTLLSSDYKYKKFIADNLQNLISRKYVEISDEEYERIHTAITTYNEVLDPGAQGPQGSQGTPTSQDIIDIQERLTQLEYDINSLDPYYDVDEDGFYFVDENGYIVAKIISTGFYAINFDSTSGSSSEQIVAALNDLTDVVITDPANGEALVYNSTATKWKNTSISGSISGDFTLVDY